MRSAFAVALLSLADMQVFHADRGGEFDNAAIDDLLDAFEIEMPLS